MLYEIYCAIKIIKDNTQFIQCGIQATTMLLIKNALVPVAWLSCLPQLSCYINERLIEIRIQQQSKTGIAHTQRSSLQWSYVDEQIHFVDIYSRNILQWNKNDTKSTIRATGDYQRGGDQITGKICVASLKNCFLLLALND